MLEITILSGEDAHPRVMLAALTEVTVRRLLLRHDREIAVSMRERGKERLDGAAETKAELIASNLAAEYALGKALSDHGSIRPEMELSVLCGEQFCGRIRFSCLLPDAPPANTPPDVCLVIVSPGAPMLALPLVTQLIAKYPDTAVCAALLCDAPPAPGETAQAVLTRTAPALAERILSQNGSILFYHPCGFTRDGLLCAPEHASPYGVQEIFWELVRTAAQRRLDRNREALLRARHTITHRNSVFQAGSPRRRLELARSRAAYTEAVKGLYEARNLLAADSGAPLTGDRKE